MLRLFRRLCQPMLLPQDGWMPQPPQHPQLLLRLRSPQRVIQSPANDKVPGLLEKGILGVVDLWYFFSYLPVILSLCVSWLPFGCLEFSPEYNIF